MVIALLQELVHATPDISADESYMLVISMLYVMTGIRLRFGFNKVTYDDQKHFITFKRYHHLTINNLTM
jgi:hypothetical protein